MRILADIGLFVLGLFIALASVSVTRVFGGPWGIIQFPVIVLVLVVFFTSDERLAAIAVGVGLGLDAVSSYPFLSWTVIVGGAALAGRWVAKKVLTNRSLPSLVMLALAVRVAYFALEAAVSRMSQVFGGTVWYRLGLTNLANVAMAFTVEMAVLIVVYIIHVRVRGERSRMLVHI